MPLLDFETALGRLVRVDNGVDPLYSLSLDDRERACLESLRQSAGFRFTVGVQRSWCVGRTMNAGFLTLSILSDDLRRRLLDEWTNSGGGTSSFFAAETNALFDFLAKRLLDPSHELTACRFEQATIRASERAATFVPPDASPLVQGPHLLRRGTAAGMVLFHGRPEVILAALSSGGPVPELDAEATPILLAPGFENLWQVASPDQLSLWEALTAPSLAAALLQDHRIETIEQMLRAGALQYESASQ